MLIAATVSADDVDDYDDDDCVSSCGIPLMPGMYQVVGFGQGDGRRSGSHGWSVNA